LGVRVSPGAPKVFRSFTKKPAQDFGWFLLRSPLRWVLAYNGFVLTERLEFVPEREAEVFAAVPAASAVFLLRGASAQAEAYVSKTANLRRRLQRLLGPLEERTKKLNLRDHVRWIEYTPTGSDFESGFVLYKTLRETFPASYAKRMRFRFAPLVKLHLENEYPRASVTTRLGRMNGRALFYGPFPSRTSAEKFMNDSLDFFKLRRCIDDLNPDPAFPGCIYSEMKMCLAPCFKGCSDEEYAAEANRVQAYFDSAGESLSRELSSQRDAASADLAFEDAAAIHVRLEKLKPVVSQLPEIVRRLDRLAALIIQPCHLPEAVTFFRVENGSIAGPVVFLIQPEDHAKSQSMESRVQNVLDSFPPAETRSALETMEQLALLKRWYYRGRRVGEIFLADDKGVFPMRRIVRGISRVSRGERPETDLLDQAKVREGIMEFPIGRESPPQEEPPQERKPQ
jgi:excinuclease ABC subunit C